MKKKNLVLMGSAAMLSLALAGSLGAVVVASASTLSDSTTNTGSTTVTYKVASTWTVEIPESIEISGKTGNGTVTAKDVVIEQGATLTVTVSSENEWKLQNSEKEFSYTLKSDKGSKANQTLTNDDDVLTVAAGTEGETTANLTVEVTDSNADKYSTGNKAYTDTLTFTVTDGDAE